MLILIVGSQTISHWMLVIITNNTRNITTINYKIINSDVSVMMM